MDINDLYILIASVVSVVGVYNLGLSKGTKIGSSDYKSRVDSLKDINKSLNDLIENFVKPLREEQKELTKEQQEIEHKKIRYKVMKQHESIYRTLRDAGHITEVKCKELLIALSNSFKV